MSSNLWSVNTPQNFWRLDPDPPDEIWNLAFQNGIHILDFPVEIKNIDEVLKYALGEARFGKNHYQIGMIRRFYYLLKPYLPKPLVYHLRRGLHLALENKVDSRWPIESRYVKFQWEILRQVLILSGIKHISFRYFWPQGKNYSFVLTHDIETAMGQRLVPVLADMEESLGFHSMFNFVPELYPLDWGLIRELQDRGFEIGVHGLKHNGRLFDSHKIFTQYSTRINKHLQNFHAHGFRAPLTIRNPEWMQLLDMEYDLSFFDTDPFEPIPGGVMSIWPFTIGHFTELPYTLPQDCTIYKIMGETSPRLWLDKIDFIEQYHGMALVIVHPDYSGKGAVKGIYKTFLSIMSDRQGFWHALPREVVSWWRHRNENGDEIADNPLILGHAALVDNDTSILISTVKGDSLTNPKTW